MSTLKVTHLQNENGSGPAMSIAVGGGVTFAGITTFHSAIDFKAPLTSAGNVGIGTDNPQYKLQVSGVAVFDDGTNARLTIGGNSTQATLFSSTT